MTFADIISLWPHPSEMAADIGAKEHQPRDWKIRGNIPSEWWVAVEGAAHERGWDDVTVRKMAAIAEQKRLADKPTEAA